MRTETTIKPAGDCAGTFHLKMKTRMDKKDLEKLKKILEGLEAIHKTAFSKVPHKQFLHLFCNSRIL